ncbi:hypothetical protein [Nitratireductor sp. XY-223]|uniref:hypothetical protein n=1 Tax=Nitratireductor sp. XY-223 TaxID=2561926 RepID=UPI0010A9ECF9|nr:hypothetical protein [Nitratireductor sp. XY-223]
MTQTSKFGPFEIGPDRYQPDPEYMAQDRPQYELNQRKLALWVGIIAVGLPFVLLIYSLFDSEGCFLFSISHYYYYQVLGDVLVGSLAFIGAFLIAYRGESRRESNLANITGVAAIGVAIFPTTGDGCMPGSYPGRAFTSSDPYVLFSQVGTVHYACAAVVFGFIAFYTLYVFTRVDQTKTQRLSDTKLTPVKYWRNMVYTVSGALIVLSIVALLYKAVFDPGWWNDYNLTFVFEAIALVSFGVSWLVKSRFTFFGLVDLNDPD